MKTIIKKSNKSQNKLLKRIKKIRKKGEKKKRGFKILKYFIFTLLILFILGIIATISVFAYFAKDLPDPNKLLERAPIESTKIFDRTGEHLLYEIHGEEKRTLIEIDTLPSYVKNATVAIEDDNFYNHHGVDFFGILRAAIKDIKSGKLSQGGSTITQQLVKNAILTKEKKFSRKIKELILSIEIERKFTKNEILQMYLNEISYGSNIYGIEAASESFFNKKAENLTISEAAALAALPQATTYYSPYGTHTDSLENRRILVLKKMKNFGYISENEYNQAKENKPKFTNPGQGIYAPHFVMYIKQYLAEKFGEKEIEQGGMRVYTTLDWDKQQIAEKAIKEGADKNEKKFGAKNAALAAIDPKTGQILAMVGSRNYFDLKNDGNVNVTIRPRQPGSSFKPFAYVEAFIKGYTPETILFDVPTNFNGYAPNNFDRKYIGPITMRSALQMSKNVAAVKTLYLAGEKETVNLAKNIGITTLNNPDRYGLSLVLGGGEVKLLDMVSAYSVFANNGIKNPIVSILKIEDNKGNIIEEYKENPIKVIDVQSACLINDVLSDNNARIPVFGAHSKLYIPGRPAAAKTGTTNDSRDAWTIGYTPSLAAGVWAGNNDNSPMKHAGGSSAAAPIWNDFMTNALKGTPVEQFTKPSPINTDKPILNGIAEDPTIYKLDIFTGKLATKNTPPTQIMEKTLKRVHCILHYINKNNPQGPAPENPASDPQYANWEEPVQKWAEENGYTEEPPTETDDIHTNFNQPKIIITSPQEGADIQSNSTFYITADVIAPLSIKEVDFLFDEQFIQSDPIKPFKIKFTIPQTSVLGIHSIKAIVYDIADNSSESVININIPALESDAQTNIKGNQTISTESSEILYQNISINILNLEKNHPLNFYVILSSDNIISPSDISHIQIINKNTKEIIWTITKEDKSRSTSNTIFYPFQWNQTSSKNYYIFAKVKLNSGQTIESSPIIIKN